jgi:Rrf2 family protein
MKLNRESRYGLEALAFLARLPEGTIVPLRDIAEARALPLSFLSKIFHRLLQHGIVRSYRGKQRGYALAKPPDALSLREILEAIEGPDLFSRCVFWNQHCEEESPCLLHAYWREVRGPLLRSLEQATLKDIAENAVETAEVERA